METPQWSALPGPCEFSQLMSGSPWAAGAGSWVLGIALPPLTDRGESSPTCRENRQQTEAFDLIFLKLQVFIICHLQIFQVFDFIIFFFLLDCFVWFLKHWKFSTSFLLSALMQAVQAISVSHLLYLFSSIKVTSILFCSYPGSEERRI